MTFVAINPAVGIRTIVRLAFGANPDADPATWTWTDVTVYVRGDVTIRKGRADWSSTADPTQISFELENTDGRFTPGNPMSPYWPNVVRNVPCQVQITGFGDPLVAPYERATGFVNGWPLTPTVGVLVVRSAIVASGKLRRLQTRRKPLRSPMYRAITSGQPVAYWPMTDAASAVRFASAVSGGAALTAIGATNFGTIAGPPGSEALADFSVGTSAATSIPAGSSTSWRVEFVVKVPTTSALSDNPSIVEFSTTGTSERYRIYAGPVGFGLSLIRVTSGTTTGYNTSGGGGPINDGALHHVRMDGTTSGGNYGFNVYFDNDLVMSDSGLAGTLGAITSMQVNAGSISTPAGPVTEFSTIGQLAVYAPFAGSADTFAAYGGHVGETAAARETRVAAEQGVRITVTTGSVGSVAAMGPQEVGTFTDVARSAEATDMGFLHDGGPNGDLVYLSLNTRFNAAVALALDYTRRHLGDSFAGTYDDQRLVNDSTVSRPSGGSGEYVDASAAVEGDYDEGPTLNVATDAQLTPIAQARVAIGVFPGLRFPVIDLDMIRSPELASQVVALALGGRATVTGLPYPLYPPGGVDQFVEGWTETLNAFKWQMALNCSPAGPYRVALIEGTTNPWVVDAGSCALNADITATATSIALKTTAGPILSTAGGDYPRDVYCDGEVIRLLTVTGAASPQTATATRSINGVVKAHLANAKVSLYRPATLAL